MTSDHNYFDMQLPYHQSEEIKSFIKNNKQGEKLIQLQCYTWLQYFFHYLDFHIKQITFYTTTLKTYIQNVTNNLTELIKYAKLKINVDSKDINTCDKFIFLHFFSTIVIDSFEKRYKIYIEELRNYESKILTYKIAIIQIKKDFYDLMNGDQR